MESAVLLLALIAAVAAVALLCRRLGFSTGRTFLCSAIVLVGTVAAIGGLAITSFLECFGENRSPEPPASWPWSPRREFCSDGDSWAARGALPLLALPFVLTALGAFLWSRKRRGLAAATFALIAVTPFAPGVYVSALPYYRLDSVPILHDPYVRPATDDLPARVCYAFGIVHGPRATSVSDETERTCVDLARTPEASVLVPDYERTSRYAYASVPYDLEWLGKRLTEEDREPGIEYEGLIAERVYTLPGDEAREGAFFVRTCLSCATP
jgi:hypothetical protein